jgi:hypothetical protein
MAYQPPQQSLFAQVIDVAILVILTVGSLYVPLYLGLAGAAKTPHPIENPTWEALNQNAVEQQRSASPIPPPPTTSSPRASTTHSAGLRSS